MQFAALSHRQSDSRYCDDATTIQFRLRGANANHLPAINSCSSLLCGSRISVIAKVILGTVTTLPQFNSVYGELMQIICQQLAPVHLCCAVRGSRHRRGDSPAASSAALMQNVRQTFFRLAPTTGYTLAVVLGAFHQV